MTFPFTYQIINYSDEVEVTISNSWNSLCHFTLDLIATGIYYHHYGANVLKSWKNINKIHPKILLMNENVFNIISNRYKNPKEQAKVPTKLFYQLKFDLNKAYSQYRDIYTRKKRLIESIKKISNTYFKFKYSVRLNYMSTDTHLDTNGVQKDKNPQQMLNPRKDIDINIPSRLFHLSSIDNDHATFDFAGPLPLLFTHNVLSLNTDWIDDKIAKLNDNASFIYRKFLSYGRTKEIEMSLIYKLLGYNNPNNIHLYKKWVEKALDELVEFGFIKKVSIGKFNRIRKTNFITFEK